MQLSALMNDTASRGRGERPGIDTKAAILEVALAQFADKGYERTTMRSVARQADVDPALIHHYFGTKRDLFEATIQFPDEVADAFASAAGLRAADILPMALAAWSEPAIRKKLTAMIRVSMSDPDAQRLFTRMVRAQLIDRVATLIDGPDAELRAALAASHVLGLVLLRYVFELEPVASIDTADLVRKVAPALDIHFQD